jgi:hypothetical protein
LPGARVRLKPAYDQVSENVVVVADPELDAMNRASRAIPARIIGVEVEWSTSVATTGTTQQPSEKATGTVVFSNRLAEEVTVPAGTVVRTSAGGDAVRFQVTEEVIVPAGIASTVEAPIEALDEFTGPDGNIQANLINRIEGPLDVQLGVTNPERMRGGGVEQVPAVTQDDYARLRSALLQQLQQRAYAEMVTSDLVGLSEFVAEKSTQVVLVLEEDYSHHIDEPAETVSLDMRVVVQSVVIDERDAREVTYAALADQIEPGDVILDNTLTFTRGDELSVDDARRVTFLMSCTGDVATEINPDTVRDLVAGLSPRRAANRLGDSFPLQEDPTIDLWPGWLGRMPLLPFRIEVEVDYSH